MEMEKRIKAMKDYAGGKDTSGFLVKLSMIFLAVATVLTLAGVALGFSAKRLMLLAVLWVCALGLTGVSVKSILDLKRASKRDMEQGDLTAMVEDFESASQFYGDTLRMGEKYVFATRGGGITAYDDIRFAGLRREPLNDKTFIQYYVVLADGKQRVIYNCEERFVDKRLIEGITFNIAARAKNVKFK